MSPRVASTPRLPKLEMNVSPSTCLYFVLLVIFYFPGYLFFFVEMEFNPIMVLWGWDGCFYVLCAYVCVSYVCACACVTRPQTYI